MLRYLNTFTRYMWLLLIPVIAFPLLFASILTFSSAYNATATLWVEQPAYITPQRAPDGNGSDSPSLQTATMLKELLGTRAFINSVIDTAPSLKNIVDKDADRQNMAESIIKNTKVEATGWRLISVSYKNEQPKLAGEVVETITARFKTYYDDRIKQQSQYAMSFYEKQIKTTSGDLDKVNSDLKKFLAENPDKVNLDGYGRPLKPEELEYVNLTQNRDEIRRRLEEARNGLYKVQVGYAAFEQGQDTYLKIQDKPDTSNANTNRTGQIAIGAGIGLLIGLAATILLTILLTIMDRSLRYTSYAQQVLGVQRVLDLSNVTSSRAFNTSFTLRRSQARQLQAAEARRLSSKN